MAGSSMGSCLRALDSRRGGLEREEGRLRDGEPRKLQAVETSLPLLLDQAHPRLLRDVLGAVDADAAREQGDDDPVIVPLDERAPGLAVAPERGGAERGFVRRGRGRGALEAHDRAGRLDGDPGEGDCVGEGLHR